MHVCARRQRHQIEQVHSHQLTSFDDLWQYSHGNLLLAQTNLASRQRSR